MLSLTTHFQIPVVCFHHLIPLKARATPSKTGHMHRVKGDSWLSWVFLLYLYHHTQSLYSHAGNSQVSKADQETREVDDGCLLFLPLSLSSFLPNAPYHKHLQSCTLLLRPHSPVAAAQWVTDQVDHLPRVQGAGICRIGLNIWKFEMRETTLAWLASNVVCRGICKPGQLLQLWTERSRKKNMAGQESSLLHAFEYSVCPAHRSWQLHRLGTQRGVVLCTVKPGPEQLCLWRWPTYRTVFPDMMLTVGQLFTRQLFPGVLPLVKSWWVQEELGVLHTKANHSSFGVPILRFYFAGKT